MVRDMVQRREQGQGPHHRPLQQPAYQVRGGPRGRRHRPIPYRPLPSTHREPKLHAAVRILPEWQALDWEAGNFTAPAPAPAPATPAAATAAGTAHTEL